MAGLDMIVSILQVISGAYLAEILKLQGFFFFLETGKKNRDVTDTDILRVPCMFCEEST